MELLFHKLPLTICLILSTQTISSNYIV